MRIDIIIGVCGVCLAVEWVCSCLNECGVTLGSGATSLNKKLQKWRIYM